MVLYGNETYYGHSGLVFRPSHSIHIGTMDILALFISKKNQPPYFTENIHYGSNYVVN